MCAFFYFSTSFGCCRRLPLWGTNQDTAVSSEAQGIMTRRTKEQVSSGQTDTTFLKHERNDIGTPPNPVAFGELHLDSLGFILHKQVSLLVLSVPLREQSF